MQIIVTFNAKALDQAIAGLDAAGQGAFRTQLAGAINTVGHAVHEAIIPPMMTQTGLTTGTIPRAIHDHPGGAGGLSYTLATRGGNISLRYFGAHETGGGVTAYPRGRSTSYPGAFIRSGRPGNRHPSPKLNGQVYKNIAGGKWGGKIKKIKSGVFIPEEMVRGAAKAVFETVVATQLEPAIASIMTIIAGRI